MKKDKMFLYEASCLFNRLYTVMGQSLFKEKSAEP